MRASVMVVVLAGMALASPTAWGQGEPPPSPPRASSGAGQRAEPAEPPPSVQAATATPTPTPTTSTSTSTSTSEDPTPTPTDYEPYAPPGITWSASSPPPPRREPSPDPSHPTSAVQSLEWGLGVLAGQGAGQAELSAGFGLGRLGVAALLSVGGSNAHVGLGVHLAGGPRFRVSDGVRFDLLADLGLVFFGREGKTSGLSSTVDSSGSDAVLPAVGARAGFTFTSARTGWYLSLGAGIRHVRQSTVTYTEQRCAILGPCVDVPLSVDYGGTVAGGYLTFGQTAAPPGHP